MVGSEEFMGLGASSMAMGFGVRLGRFRSFQSTFTV